jgi:hypothetical protein
MAYTGSNTAGNLGDEKDMGMPAGNFSKLPRIAGSSKLFQKKNPGSPGKLGKASTKSESLSKLRGKGALA